MFTAFVFTAICLVCGLVLRWARYASQRLEQAEIDRIIAIADRKLMAMLKKARHVCASHGIAHVRKVRENLTRALRNNGFNLTIMQKLALHLAALLHDADDHKLFPDSTEHLENASEIVEATMNELSMH